MQTNVWFDHQHWYKQTQHLERHISVLVSRSTDYLQYQWHTRLIENQRFTAAVWPPSQWQKNIQTPDLLVLPYYLCLKFIFRFYVTQFDVFFVWFWGEYIMTVKFKNICYENNFNCGFDSIRKNMWQVSFNLYLTGIDLIYWMFLSELCR